MVPASPKPTDIRSLAVTAEDVVAAVETNRTSDRTAVLRVTPPFSGRMRARLHVKIDDTDASDTIELDPETLLEADAPDYPRPAETEDRLRTDPDTEYSVEKHRQRHEAAVEAWRTALPEHIRSAVTLSTSTGPHTVDVSVLG
jgi:hypothetical protein